MLFSLRTEPQFVDVVEDLAQVVAALDLVLDLPENLPDLVFDRVRPAGLLLEPMQIRKELAVDEVPQVIARLWSIPPSLPFGAAHTSQRYGLSRMKAYFFPSNAASSALSCSSPSRYFRNNSQEVCSV